MNGTVNGFIAIGRTEGVAAWEDVRVNDAPVEWQRAIKAFGGQLGQLREEAGWTVRKLAEAIGVAPATVSKAENGGHAKPPDFYLVKQWVAACAIHAEEDGRSLSLSANLEWWRGQYSRLERLHEDLRSKHRNPKLDGDLPSVRDPVSEHQPHALRFEVLHQKTVDHLADRMAHVRMAALRTLGDLGDEYPEKRQRIVHELCDYLRVPLEADDAGEIQVRRAAQIVLASRLRPERGKDKTFTNPSFWPDMDVDLKKAHLIDLDFTTCEFRRADFDEARFEGETHFNCARFVGEARFVGVVFLGYEASFQNVRFERISWFRWAAFHGYADFQGAYFGVNAEFSRAQFSENAHFDGIEVMDHLWITHAVFHGAATFRLAQAKGATFWLTSFRSSTDFRHVQFASLPRVAECEATDNAEHHWPGNWVELTAEDARESGIPWPQGWVAVVEAARATEIQTQWRLRTHDVGTDTTPSRVAHNEA